MYHKLDLIGLQCPLPVLKVKQALSKASFGDQIEVLCTDPLAEIDIPHLIQQCGDEILTYENHGNIIRFVIKAN